MMYDEGVVEDEPKSTFVTYLAEGDKLCNAALYEKALESYNTALQIEPDNKTALVARSKCYLLIGDNESSLKDAEVSLKEDKNFHKGLFQKSQALYQMGDFEQALMYFHRGYKLRPELEEFRLGIQKSQEAIENCVGTPSSIKLENKGDLSFFNKMDEVNLKARGQYRMAESLAAARGARAANTRTIISAKTTKTLLGELYVERQFLEKLLRDEDLVKGSAKGINIYDLVVSEIDYLDTRTEFWRQQKPLYARKRDRKLLEEQWNRKPSQSSSDFTTTVILNNLEQIDSHLIDGKTAESLQLALSTLKTVNKLSDNELPTKADVVGNLHSCIGNAYLELGQTDTALIHHQIDLDIAKKNDSLEARSRAFDNLGRVHARIGNYQKAIDCWEEKLPLSKSEIENTWLYHEIGRCHLALESFDKAREFGLKSLEESKKAEDEVWQLNACVLVAEAEVKLEKYEDAAESFNKCLENAKLQGDEVAEIAINKALEDVREKLRTSEKQVEESADKEAEPEDSEDVDDNKNDDNNETSSSKS